MERKYTIEGQEVEIAAEVPGGFLVYYIYEGEDGSYTDKSNPRVVDKVFDNPPVEKYSKDVEALQGIIERLLTCRTEISEELRELEAERTASLERLKQVPALKFIEEFIDKKVTHYAVLDDYGRPRVVAFKDALSDEDCGDKKTKLLTLYGGSNGDLTWKLNRYSDGSGHHESVVPCTSEEQAIEEVKKHILQMASGKVNCWTPAIIESAKLYKVALPAEYLEAVRKSSEAALQKTIAESKAAIEKAELELAKLTPLPEQSGH